jgi:MutS domain V
MSVFFRIAIAALVVAAVAIRVIRAARARTLERLRADWGQPIDRTRRLDAIGASHRSRAATTGSASMDAQTWADLDLDDVFAALDRTASTLGQQALYHRLRTTPVGDHLDAFEALVERMASDAPARERAQIALERLQDPHGYDLWWLGAQDAIETRRWHVVFPLLSLSATVTLVLVPFLHSLVPALVALLVLGLLIRNFTDARVTAVSAAFRQLAPVIATGQALGFLRDGAIAPLVGPLSEDAPGLGRLKTIARWVSGDPFMLSVNPNPLAALLTSIVSVVYDYLDLVLLLGANGAYFGAEELRRNGPALVRVVAAIGEVDAAISVASVRASAPAWTRPRFAPSGSPARLTGICHPLLDDPVANSIAIEPGRGVLVTGSNMSGKTTFLRTVGVSAVLAQTIDTCFAASYDAPVFTVRSVIGRSDSLQSGKSYYIAEVEALLELVAAGSGPDVPHLFLLDELFRGTNAVERIAAGAAVLAELVAGPAGPKPHIALAATHDAELVDLLAGAFDPYHFGDAVGPEGLIFDHRLHPGSATTRNAIALLRLHGAPEPLLQRAMATAARLDRERGVTLESR